MRYIFRSIFLAVFFFFNTLAFAANAIPKEEMVKFVDEAADYVKSVGKEAALTEFNNQKGKFYRHGGELYMFAYDKDGINLALGQKPQLKGQSLIKVKDSKGVYFVEKLRDLAIKSPEGKGFLEYHFENPASKKVEKKLGYVRKIDDNWWIGSGIYLNN